MMTSAIFVFRVGPNGPRPPPILFHWPAPQIGAVHEVTTLQSYWKCSGPMETCQSKESVKLQLEVVSQEPRVFIIPNFLSDFEAETIIEHARPKIDVSQVGNYDAGNVDIIAVVVTLRPVVILTFVFISDLIYCRRCTCELYKNITKCMGSKENL